MANGKQGSVLTPNLKPSISTELKLVELHQILGNKKGRVSDGL